MRHDPKRSMSEVAVATVTSLAPGGDGVAHLDRGGERRAVFVPRSAPGDTARLEIDMSRRPARGRVLELLAAGPGRVASACPWSERCGGCDWMHLSLDAQERAHRDHLRAALPEAWRDAPIVDGSLLHAVRGPALAYRSRARVHARSDRRGRVRVGMHEAGSHEPVEVETCAVLDARLDRARASLPALLGGSSGRGEIQLGLGAGGLPVLDLWWNGELAASAFAGLEAAVQHGALAGARITLEGANRPAIVGDPTPWTTGPDGEPLRLPPGGFAQASERVNTALAHHVAEQVGTRVGVGAPVVELFAGAGNLSVLLARGADLVCVESAPDACQAARANLSARRLSARVVDGDANAFEWSAGTRALVLDPPRTGARPVAERVAASRIPLVVYVSCDTQTLSRDLHVLAAAVPPFAPASVAAFEMFPQTSHVESVVVLERRGR
jgi:23S rRNA (uracil1939-C5)-methyltransferase